MADAAPPLARLRRLLLSAGALEIALVVALCAGGLAMRGWFGRGNFVFAGSDSYGYNKLADELREHGRYAMGPPPEPLAWVRPPVYPIWVALVKGAARAEMSGGDGWLRLKRANVWL